MPTESGHPDMPTSVERMLRPERAETLDPFRVMSHCPVNPRDTVADIGCGPGYFTLPLAKYLIYGKVFALDASDEMIQACQERVNQARLGNVEVVKCEEYEFPVEAGVADGLFISVTLHHPEDRVRFLTAAKEMLKPGGWCFIVEWQKKETESGPPQQVRITTEELRQIAKDSGFKFQSSLNLNSDYFVATLINRR
ncbi:MAG TPA: class I SAM-dependent methyltransferase [Dehalococcoidia bacterium]|jgi:ubiquinone/menaquinone biosynthesis C-methylase UbiE|nr:class I SAM-dependent methyltransferase [Dehalococcoidia bacterium]